MVGGGGAAARRDPPLLRGWWGWENRSVMHAAAEKGGFALWRGSWWA